MSNPEPYGHFVSYSGPVRILGSERKLNTAKTGAKEHADYFTLHQFICTINWHVCHDDTWLRFFDLESFDAIESPCTDSIYPNNYSFNVLDS